MSRRPVIVYVGEDTTMRDWAADAVAAAWSDPRSIAYETVSPAELATRSDALSRVADACGVVTTVDALTSEHVRAGISGLPEAVPVIAIVTESGIRTLRTVLDAGVDDVVAIESAAISGAAQPTPTTDRLAERLRAEVTPALTRVGGDGIARLREVLLDAGTTLMSARSDEVETKIAWTMENVGEQVEVDRIVCYLEEEDAFRPAYHWSSGAADPGSRQLADFPDADTLSTFGNVVRPLSLEELETSPESGQNGTAHESATPVADGDEPLPTATVHVPLVTDWELVGVLAFETDDERVWTEEEVAAYRTFGDLIAHTIARNERRMELRRQTERLEQFSAVVSHDLRNPLNVLSGYLELVEADVDPSKYEPMERAVHRMETLIDDLLMLARRGDAIDKTEPVPIASVAEDAWDSIRAPDARLTITEEIDHVDADPSRLRQLFENLFRNAVDHGGPDVDIEVGATTSDPDVGGMYVADDGPGIAPDARDALFDSGFSTAGSSGLGLAIVERIADAHGWEIDARNDGGAVFELSFQSDLPMASA